MPLGESPLTELRVFIELLRPYSTAQEEEKLLKNKPFRFSPGADPHRFQPFYGNRSDFS